MKSLTLGWRRLGSLLEDVQEGRLAFCQRLVFLGQEGLSIGQGLILKMEKPSNSIGDSTLPKYITFPDIFIYELYKPFYVHSYFVHTLGQFAYIIVYCEIIPGIDLEYLRMRALRVLL